MFDCADRWAVVLFLFVFNLINYHYSVNSREPSPVKSTVNRCGNMRVGYCRCIGENHSWIDVYFHWSFIETTKKILKFHSTFYRYYQLLLTWPAKRKHTTGWMTDRNADDSWQVPQWVPTSRTHSATSDRRRRKKLQSLLDEINFSWKKIWKIKSNDKIWAYWPVSTVFTYIVL